MRFGQVIAIPVLDRHIKTSSGKCSTYEVSYVTSCVMADALRDRFPGITNLEVGTSATNFNLPDGTAVYITAHGDMESGILAFDDILDEVRSGSGSFSKWSTVLTDLRNRIPRVVHATVAGLYPVGY